MSVKAPQRPSAAALACLTAAYLTSCSYGTLTPVQDGGLGGGDAATHDTGAPIDDAGTADGGSSDAGPESMHSVVQIASGYTHSCARFADGRVKCWGANDRGQLGLGDTQARGDGPNEMGDALPEVQLGKDRHAVEIAVGRDHSCARLDDGSVKCWGSNFAAQLGVGTRCLSECDTVDPEIDSRGDAPGEMGDDLPILGLGAGRTARALSAGGDVTCVVTDDDALRCWGSNDSGALGASAGCAGPCMEDYRGDVPGELGSALPAIDVGATRDVIRFDVGRGFTLAILDNGSIVGWGWNGGTLGVGDVQDRGDNAGEMGSALDPVLLPDSTTALQVFAGEQHSCALLDDDHLYCWGYNAAGQLGVGDIQTRCDIEGSAACIARLELTPAQSASSVALGYRHTCAIDTAGELRCWGDNEFGALGLGDTPSASAAVLSDAGRVPVTVPLPKGRRYTAVTAGAFFSCALADDGSVRCWGTNDFGQLGLGDTRTRGAELPGQAGSLVVSLGN